MSILAQRPCNNEIVRMFILALSAICVYASVWLQCPAGSSLGEFRLDVRRRPTDLPLSLRQVNQLQEGDVVEYVPELRRNEKRPGQVTLVFVPPLQGQDVALTALKPSAAGKRARWIVPFTPQLVVFVYGPSGIKTAKVEQFLSKDTDLVRQLAEYADKTAQTEAVLQALNLYNETGASEPLAAALQGFAAQYNVAARLDRNAPPERQTMDLIRSLNPALAAYDPISPRGAQRISQTASLATFVAAMFFGTNVGLAAGSTAMALNVKSLLLPNTEFRSSFAQQAPTGELALCGRRDAVQGRTRLAYLWALRLPGGDPPRVTTDGVAHLLAGVKGSIALSGPDGEVKRLDRVQEWFLTSPRGRFRLRAYFAPDKRTLEVDLQSAAVPEGKYQLGGRWDWTPFAVPGAVEIHAPPELSSARLTPDSQDRMIEHSGRQIVELEGDDFQFVEKVLLSKKGSKYDPPVPIPFSLPLGPRKGVQKSLELAIDTTHLSAGVYTLTLMQAGASKSVDIQVLAPPPKVASLPIRINQGEERQTVLLRGEGLDRIVSLEASGIRVTLGLPAAGGSERPAVIELTEPLQKGATLDLAVRAEGYARPLILSGGLRVVGPRPRITAARLSLPPDPPIALKEDELPAGVLVGAMLQVQPTEGLDRVRLACVDNSAPAETAAVGERAPGLSVQALGAGSLYVSFDPGRWPIGCQLTVSVEASDSGASKPRVLGRVVRLPLIETFTLTSEAAGPSEYVGIITGTDLEMIERTGWDGSDGLPVLGLPAPLAGEGHKQSLKIRMRWPSPAPQSPLWVWLRGDKEGRITNRRY